LIPLAILILGLTVTCELFAGRTLFGTGGQFGWLTNDIWSEACSQRLLDPYSFSHICHGLVFYFLLWLVTRQIPMHWRFLTALCFEASWEILENSPFIIERYREATIAIGYAGDSIVNSLSDILMMSIGFLAAWKLRPRSAACLFLCMEIGCAIWIRDNLSMNVLMLVKPVAAIKEWQLRGRVGK
jgi:hypothetical protein